MQWLLLQTSEPFPRKLSFETYARVPPINGPCVHFLLEGSAEMTYTQVQYSRFMTWLKFGFKYLESP